MISKYDTNSCYYYVVLEEWILVICFNIVLKVIPSIDCKVYINGTLLYSMQLTFLFIYFYLIVLLL